MRIGFSTIFPYRPHSSHEAYLKHLAELAGHQVFAQVCGGSKKLCYNKALKGSGLLICAKCHLGSSRAYWPRRSINQLKPDRPTSGTSEITDALLAESAGFLYRAETEAEENSVEFSEFSESFRPVSDAAYQQTLEWIAKNRLDALIVFNGRQDMTAATVLAAKHAGVPYLTHERTWFGPGLKLNPGQHCNSLRHIADIVGRYDDVPLTAEQSAVSFRLLASRFNQSNELEWRLYNPEPEAAAWPDQHKGANARVLIVPSSRCEFLANPEYATGWGDNLEALTALVRRLREDNASVVLRCHPVWAQNIGTRSGDSIEAAYSAWAREHDVTLIPAASKASTYDLIRQADTVVLNGGSSAVEAGFLGKQVVCLSPSGYQNARFAQTLLNESDVAQFSLHDRLEPSVVCASTMRYVYSRYGRFPQYVDFVRPIATTQYQFLDGGNPDRMMSALLDQRLVADDERVASSDKAEAGYVSKALAMQLDWDPVTTDSTIDAQLLQITPRWPYNLVYALRPFLKMGDNR